MGINEDQLLLDETAEHQENLREKEYMDHSRGEQESNGGLGDSAKKTITITPETMEELEN